MPEGKTHYDVLGVAPDSSADDVRQAFHRFAREHHPDNFSFGSAEEQENIAELYRQGTEAYRVLRNPQSRKEYDLSLSERSGKTVARTNLQTMKLGAAFKVSNQARPYYASARRAIQAEKWKEALMQIQIALRYDKQNEALFVQLKMLEAKIKRK